METKDDIKKDLEEFGIEEILAQYMMNPFAEELVVEYIQGLQKEIEYLRKIKSINSIRDKRGFPMIKEESKNPIYDITDIVEQAALFDGQKEVSYEGYVRIPIKLNLINNEDEIYFKNIGFSSDNFRVVLLDKDDNEIFDYKLNRKVNKGDGILFRKYQFRLTFD